MSTKKELGKDKYAYLILGSMLVVGLALPFVRIEQFALFWLLAIFLISLVVFTDTLRGLLLLLIIRPVLDIFTDKDFFSIGEISINLAAILGVMTILFGFVAIIKETAKRKRIPLVRQWILFFSLATLSILWSISVSLSASELVRLGTIFSLFVLGFLATEKFRDSKKISKAIIFSAFVPALFATHQFFTKTGFTLNFEDVPNRVFGTFAHPNPFAYFLTLILALLLFFVLKRQNRHRILAVLYFSGIVCLLVLTYTRGAWLVLVGTILLVGIVRYRKFLLLCLALMFFAYLTIEPIQIRIDSLVFQGPSSSIKWRLELWNDSLEYISEHPLLGYGFGTSEEVIMEKRGIQFGSTIPHNDYLGLVIEVGIVGLAFYLTLLISLLLLWLGKLKKLLSSDSENSLLLLVFTSFAIVIFGASAVDNILEATALQWAFWAMAGTIFSSVIERKAHILEK